MKNASNQELITSDKRFEYELKLFQNLSSGLCCTLETILDLFDTFSPKQKSQFLREIENTKLNIHSVTELLGSKRKKYKNDSSDKV
jgi:hypothetical protein